MNIQLDKMCDWERKKAVFLLGIAEGLGMDTSAYGELAVNGNSGYTYLWLEDYAFTLFMPISCELVITDVQALWTNPEDGEEVEMSLTETTRLKDLEDWTASLDKKAEEESEEASK